MRDLQSLYWIGKYIHGVRDASELVRHKVFSQEEYETFRAAHEFLWAVRCHLHLIASRAQDQLTFDMQVAVSDAHGLRRRRRPPRRSSISCRPISATPPWSAT